MLSTHQKPYKKASKANRKKKVGRVMETAEFSSVNSRKRNPVVSLPEINPTPIHMEYRRFVNNAQTVDFQDLKISSLAGCFTVATTAVLGRCYARAFRIKKIRLLSPVTTQGTSVFCQIIPQGIDAGINSFNAIPESFMDSSASIDVPAYISLSPSIDTPLGSWHYNTGVDLVLAKVTAPAGSTLDILFEYILAMSDPVIGGYSRVLVAATIGVLSSGPILNTLFDPIGVNVL